MKHIIRLVIFTILTSLFSSGLGQEVKNHQRLFLFTDRDFCTSGDTLWFKVFKSDFANQKENVIHIQLDGLANNIIRDVIKKTDKGWAEGYFKIPDSLSTGQYFVSAFVNSQSKQESLMVQNKSLLVYNRFEEQVTELNVLVNESRSKPVSLKNNVKINLQKEIFKSREKVNGFISINPSFKIKTAQVRASVVDPLASKLAGNYYFKMNSLHPAIPVFFENNGFIVSGRVTDENGEVQSNVMVLLSITREPPYFDYYYTGKDGYFHFFLKEALGKAKIVLQPLMPGNKEYNLEIVKNGLQRDNRMVPQKLVLDASQSDFVTSILQAKFIDRLFTAKINYDEHIFEMPARFDRAFYGLPSRRIIPDEFYDLPDFREISRELLSGVQYRTRDDQPTLRVVDEGRGGFFYTEPLRLINGIPVFKNSLFTNLKSTDINYIDIVKKERIFGDLSFNGVLAISLYDKSNKWLAQQSNVFQFEVNGYQPSKVPYFGPLQPQVEELPDIRKVYHWQTMTNTTKQDFEFILSDLKGKVAITVEGITDNNEPFNVTKLIEVE